MNYFFLDASALAKRYVYEPGTVSVNHLLGNVPKDRLILLIIGLGEISSILVRKKNAKQISESFYHHAFAEFKKELLDDTNISIQSVKDNLVRESLLFVEKYSLNATDAIILRCALNVKYTLMTDDDLVLVTTDIRLSNAAKSSGLKVWNPETDSPLDEDV